LTDLKPIHNGSHQMVGYDGRKNCEKNGEKNNNHNKTKFNKEN
jgi:hypothetical protein